MDVIGGNKRFNQKGYVLLESLIAFLIITSCISLYLPIIVGLLETVKKEKVEVDLVRIAYEQSQKITLNQELDSSWQTGEIIYDINLSKTSQRKGVHIQYNDHEKKMDILSIEITRP